MAIVKKKPAWFLNQSPANQEAIHDRLVAGVTTTKLARDLQEQHGLFKDIKLSNLAVRLAKYKAGWVVEEQTKHLMGTTKSMGVPALVRRLNVVSDIEDLVTSQKERVTKALDLERKANGLLTQQASNEMKLLSDLLDKLGRMYLETGLLPRAAKKVTGSLLDQHGNSTQFTWTEEDAQLLGFLEDVEYSEVDDDD